MTARRLAVSGALVVAALPTLSLAAAANAATTAPSATAPSATATTPQLNPALTLREVDATGFPTVRVDVQIVGATPASVSVSQNGIPIQAVTSSPLADAHRTVGTVLVLDTSESMSGAGRFSAMKAAADAYVEHKAANEAIAVVATGSVARVVSGFTLDPAALHGAIDGLEATGELDLRDGILEAASLFDGAPNVLANLVVIAGRRDTVSKISVGQTVAAEGAANATVYTVAIPGFNDFDPSTVGELATGGGTALVSTPQQLTAALTAIQDALHSTVELRYVSPVRSIRALDVVLATSGMRAEAHVVPGTVSIGSNAQPAVVRVHQAPGPLRGGWGVLLIAVLALLAAGLLAYGVINLTTAPASTLTNRLQPYADPGTWSSEAAPADEGQDPSLVHNRLLASFVERTGRFAQRQGILDRVETMLEQADLAVRPNEALFLYLLAVAFAAIVAGVLKGPIMALVALVVMGLLPPAVLSALAAKRLRKFNAQLPDTLQLLASSLRAGFSFLQGVEAVAHEAADPIAGELRRVLAEARLGRPVEVALQDCANRMHSPDFDWAVMAVRIQREVGGNLAELLQTVSETMVERERLRRDVKALTAEGRVSAIVLGIMPPALGVLFYITNPTYMEVLFHNMGGQIALGISAAVAVAGFLWMKKIVDIKV